MLCTHWFTFAVIFVLPPGGYVEYTCPPSYSCRSTKLCGKIHNQDYLNEMVLFRCGPDNLCCPPKPYPVISPSSTLTPLESTKSAISDRNTQKESAWITERPGSKLPNSGPTSVLKDLPTTPSLSRDDFRPTTQRAMGVHGFSMTFEHRNKKLLPMHCGAAVTSNKIVAGEDALVGEYPWMALIGFTGYNGVVAFVCGGTLISDRYVLTAAHCLHKEGATLTHVRLGEFDLSSEKDCNGEDCYKPAVDINVEKIISHEKWNVKTYRNDIGLVRLNVNVTRLGMATILPICLPIDIAALNITDNYKYETVGWGMTGWREHSLNKVLQKTTLGGINITQCNAAICPENNVGSYCPIVDSQVCVQGVHKRDVCKGDSGGPLTTYRTLNIVQIGITSFKATEICGDDNIPTVFTRVDKYVNWILDHIEP